MSERVLPPLPEDDGAAGELTDDPVVQSYRAVDRGIWMLRMGAYLAAAVWIVSIVANAVVSWQASDRTGDYIGPGFQQVADDHSRLATVVTQVTATSWAYLFIALLAFGLSVFVESRRLNVLIDATSEEDDIAGGASS